MTKKRELELEAMIREHQTTTAILVALGVALGVAVAAWVLNRPLRDAVRAEDPEAPLFI
jgi:hypothetical protein